MRNCSFATSVILRVQNDAARENDFCELIKYRYFILFVVGVKWDRTFHMLIRGVKYFVLSLSAARHRLVLPIFVPQSSQAQPGSVRPISMHDYVSVSIMKPEVRVYIRKPGEDENCLRTV